MWRVVPSMIPRVVNHRHCRFAIRAASSTTTDVLIVGGGVVGCALARQLATQLPTLQVTVLERGPGSASIDAAKKNKPPPPHPRSYALSPASLDLLGIQKGEESSSLRHDRDRIGWYDSMQVWEAQQPASLVFSSRDLDSSDCLGAVVEDSVLQRALWSDLQSSSLELFANATIAHVQFPSSGDHGLVQVKIEQMQQPSSPMNKQNDKTESLHLNTRLIVAADGANSHIRQTAGISFEGFDYGEQARTFTVELQSPHRGRAFQRFLPTGPLALLPTFSPLHAIVVWSSNSHDDHDADLIAHMNELLQAGPDRIESLFPSSEQTDPFFSMLHAVRTELDRALETVHYGAAMASQELQASAPRPFVGPPLISKVASPQFAFPLSTRVASRFTENRLALVGDAAHTVHPMAGQGLNLGLQDVSALVRVVKKAHEAGMDPAQFLQEYEQSRQHQVTLTLAGIHALHQVFGVQHVAAKHVKSLGMSLIQTASPLRRALVRAACQGVA